MNASSKAGRSRWSCSSGSVASAAASSVGLRQNAAAVSISSSPRRAASRWMRGAQRGVRRPEVGEHLAHALEAELGREVAAAAIDQVVRLVDHQDDVGEVVAGAELGERHVGIEDVVVVADHRLRFARDLEAHLERADLGRLGLLRTRRRAWTSAQVSSSRCTIARGAQLDEVVARVAAVLLVADHLVVGAHARLGAQAHRAEGALGVEQAEHVPGHVLLQVLGGEDEHALVVALRVAQHRVERRHGLAQAGGGLDQQVLALLERLLDALDDLELARARRGVGEDAAARRPGGAPRGARRSVLALADELAEPAAHAGLDRGGRHLEAKPLDRLGADLDQHQLDFDRSVLEPRQHPGVDRGLALVGLAHQRRELARCACTDLISSITRTPSSRRRPSMRPTRWISQPDITSGRSSQTSRR